MLPDGTAVVVRDEAGEPENVEPRAAPEPATP
jgi:hypothetical protein